MKIQFPYKVSYSITQGYDQNQSYIGYKSGRHGGIDVVPVDKNHKEYPAPIYAVLPGQTLAANTTDKNRGKGIRVRSALWPDIIEYFKGLNLIPQNYNGKVYLNTLYWHMLEVTDLDGTIDQDTPLGTTGNTGDVYGGGQKVPDSMKGVPPYPGLHLHFESSLEDENGNKFNLDKDVVGRFDPMLLFAYKGEEESMIYQIENTLTLVEKRAGRYWVIATKPDLFPFVASILGLPIQAEYPKITQAEVDAKFAGYLKAGLTYCEK